MLETPSITSTHVDGIAIVALHGEHDLTTVDELRGVLAGLGAAGSRIVVDLSGATFIDSTTLGTILGSRSNGKSVGNAVVVVAPLGAEPRRVLDLVQAGDRVRVFPIRELAIAALAQRPSMFLDKR